MAFNEDYKWVEVQTWYSEESQPAQNSSTGYKPAQANTKRTGSGPDGQLISPEDTPFYQPTEASESVDAAV